MLTDDPELAKFAEHYGRQVETCILAGNIDAAHEAVKVAFERLQSKVKVGDADSVDRLVSLPIATILAGGGIHTVGQLCKQSRDTLNEVFQIRYRSIDIIEQRLAASGLQLTRPECSRCQPMGGGSKMLLT